MREWLAPTKAAPEAGNKQGTRGAMSSARDYLAEREESREWARRTVEKHAPLVNRIARHLLARMPANVQIDDLVQSGMIGLLDAAKKYDHTKGASFETYAGIRIQGAMLDEVRKGDWTPRSVHRKSREVAKAIQKIEARTGRNASEKEIAGELKIDLDTYFNILKDSSGTRLFSFDEINESADPALELVEGDLPDPADNMQQGRFREDLASAIDTLPEREKLVLSLYYDEELNLKEIGEIIGVSESRVSQIHSLAALRLRSKLSVWR